MGGPQDPGGDHNGVAGRRKWHRSGRRKWQAFRRLWRAERRFQRENGIVVVAARGVRLVAPVENLEGPCTTETKRRHAGRRLVLPGGMFRRDDAGGHHDGATLSHERTRAGVRGAAPPSVRCSGGGARGRGSEGGRSLISANWLSLAANRRDGLNGMRPVGGVDRRAAMDWRRAESGVRYRIAGSGKVVIELESGGAAMAESSRLVYRRGEVDWSLAASGRGVVGKWPNRAQRQAAGMAARMSRYEGAGEVGFAPASPGAVSAVELRPGVAEVVCQAESLVAVEAGDSGRRGPGAEDPRGGVPDDVGDDPAEGRERRVPVCAWVGGGGRVEGRRRR